MILAGALFYATITFSFFVVSKSSKYYVIYHTSKVYTKVQKMHISHLKMKAKPNCTPPIFITSDILPVHGDVSPVLGPSISVSNLAFKWWESISMGEVLYSTKWVKYSTLPQATT